jgi:uncharacterized OB-fold protein
MSMAGDLASEFWAGCAEGELRYQRCPECGVVQFHARPFCRQCGATPEWATSRGLGTVYAVTRVSRAPTPEFAALTPYEILLVDLDEGFRMMAHGVAGLAIGERVCVAFAPVGGRGLPRFDRLREKHPP